MERDEREEAGEGAGSRRARIGGDRGAGDVEERERDEQAKAVLQARKRSDGGLVRGRGASRSRNAGGRRGPRNTGRRTSQSEAGSRRGLQATLNRLERRSGGRAAGGRTVPRTRSAGAGRLARGGAVKSVQPGQRTRSGARKAGKNRKR